MYKKRVAVAVGACALLGVMTLGGTLAYLTDAETAANTITVGKIQIDLTEPEWENPATDTDNDGTPDKTEREHLEPMQKVAKDPKITNTGTNDALVFMKVSVPVENVATAKADGTKVAAADTQLFNFYCKDASGNLTAGMNTAKWVALNSGIDETINSKAYRTYTYGYADVLPKDASTETLFDQIQLVNVIEGQIDSEAKDILVTAYAIQTNEVNGQTVEASGNDAVVLNKIWTVLQNQKTGETVPEAESNNAMDLSGTAR